MTQGSPIFGYDTVRQALQPLTVENLKALLALLPGAIKLTRKADLVEAIEPYLGGAELRELWGRLDLIQRAAVAETIHSPAGIFDPERFEAIYAAQPCFAMPAPRGWGEVPTLLRLFIYPCLGQEVVPRDLRRRLLEFVPAPPKQALAAVDGLPACIEYEAEQYIGGDGPAGRSGVERVTLRFPLMRRDTEADALADLPTVLRLIDQGRIIVSDKTLRPNAAAVRFLGGHLQGGDFYPPASGAGDGVAAVGPIKAFAWPMLLQAAGLAESQGKKLALTKAGRLALGKPAAEALRQIWRCWLKTTLLDEFNRIDTIKGQTGKGKQAMTAASGRRAKIKEALAECLPGEWIGLDDLSRFLRAAGYRFEVTRNPWTLYIEDSDYGSLGYSGGHRWGILQERYLKCFLFEYAATLGLVDVGYTEPEEAPADYGDLWGADDLAFLSRYDGLAYFRLTALGAYCLGRSEQYQPPRPRHHARLSALSNLTLRVEDGSLAPDAALLLEAWAERESDTVWRLDPVRALRSVESGRPVSELRLFLQAGDEQPLPETVEGFLLTAERQGKALRCESTALLVECVDVAAAERIAGHELTRRLCLRAGDRHLVVKVEQEDAFRKAVHVLGYGMPRS